MKKSLVLDAGCATLDLQLKELEVQPMLYGSQKRFDKNGDGKVDQLDITIAQAFYQARSTDIDWNTPGANGAAPSACDVTGDSVVDIQDLIAIYLNFTA